LAIGDVRKSHGNGQDGSCTAVRVKSFALLADPFCNAFHPTLLSGGGSASPKTMADQSPKAQRCSLAAAGMKSLALSADLLPTR
jgi:hypothetical protein